LVNTPSAPREITKPANSSELLSSIVTNSPDPKTISKPTTDVDKTPLLLPEP